jgi:vesicle coat complex subunit
MGSGFSDSVYAEACVTVQQFDIVLGRSSQAVSHSRTHSDPIFSQMS